MYIKNLSIANFRGIKNLNIEFKKGLNIIVGENNSGKTTILDAIRICLSYGTYQSDIYIKKTDFIAIDEENASYETIEFHFEFEKEEEEELGGFHTLVGTSGDEQVFQAHFKYWVENRNGQLKIRSKIWGGDNEGSNISTEAFNDLVFFIHLDALRDATSKLRPGRNNKLGELFNKLEPSKEKQNELVVGIKESLQGNEAWNTLLGKGSDSINTHLNGISLTSYNQNVNLNFIPFEYRKIVNRIEMKLNEKVMDGTLPDTAIEQNGLGFNNLIYSSVVLSELKTFKQQEKASLAALLIEEPEAHLHPQQQNIFFQYLDKLNKEIKFQLFVTSHSPTLASKASLESIICLNKACANVTAFSPSKALKKPSIDHLHRFLDTTKSQLFFSNGVILVEGISEALLLPMLAKKMGDNYDFVKNGIEVVNLNGVAFKHFGNLFNNSSQNLRFPFNCSILTDDDRSQGSDEISSRAQNAKDLEKENLKVFLAEQTFEVELFKSKDNKQVLLDTWKELHPKSLIQESDDVDVHANNLLNKIAANKAKAEFAHALSVKLDSGAIDLTVPVYIQDAIKWVTDGRV